MTEEQEKARYKKTLDIMHHLENEFEVLGNAYDMQNIALAKLKAEYETQGRKIQGIQKDLGLREQTYRNKTTRQLAQEAFNQSTVIANWEGLGKHPVIDNIYADIKNRSTNEGRRADDILSKLENQMSVEEFFEHLSKSSEVREIKTEIEELNELMSDTRTTQSYDRSQANKQDLTIRDKMSDFETALEILEFIGSEHWDTIRGSMIFLMGVFAQMGYKEVGEGLRVMLKISKVEELDGKKDIETTETPKE